MTIITQRHQTLQGCYLVFCWDVSDISTPAIASAQHWNHSASEYSPDFPFWHRAIEPRNLPTAKSHSPSCKPCLYFSVSMDQKGGPLSGHTQLEGGFQVLLIELEPLITFDHTCSELLCLKRATSYKDVQSQGWTHLTRNKTVSCSFLCSSGVAEIREAKKRQILLPAHIRPFFW